MKTFLKTLPVPLLIVLYVYAAAEKLLDFHAFGSQLDKQGFPLFFSALLHYALPAAELLAAALLCAGRTCFAGLQLSLYMLLVFTAYIILVLLHLWSRHPCPCGGVISHLSWGGHLVFNCFFLCLNLIAISIQFKERRPVT